MRTRSKVILFVGVAGLGATGFGIYTNHVDATKAWALANPPTTTTTTTLPPGTPVGFNAARTEFVLPHGLGLLPAPELALAVADPAYAAGLANAWDWEQLSVSFWKNYSPKLPLEPLWEYDGAAAPLPPYAPPGAPPPGDPFSNPSTGRVGDLKADVVVWNGLLVFDGAAGVATKVSSSSVTVRASTIHTVEMSTKGVIPYGSEILAPSALEILAAPFTGSSSGGAICVPVPEAFVTQGFLGAVKVSTLKTEPVITAGPSTVFGGYYDQSPPGSFNIKGVASCNNFH